MARVKVKKIASEEDAISYMGDLNDMFNGDPEVCTTNYLSLVANIDDVFAVLRVLCNSHLFPAKEEFAKFESSYIQEKAHINAGSTLMADPTTVQKYKNFKACPIVVHVLDAYKFLLPHSQNILAGNVLGALTNGDEFTPFYPLPRLNLQHTPRNDLAVKAVNAAFKMIFTALEGMYKVIRRPDVNLDMMTEALMRGITDIQKTIPRHNRAFDYIKSHNQLLRTTIEKHYIDYESSQGNSTVILSAYFKELSRSEDAGPELKIGLRAIVAEIKNRVRNNSMFYQNPNIKAAMRVLDELEI